MTAQVYRNEIEEDVRKHLGFINKNKDIINREAQSKLSDVDIKSFQLSKHVPETIAIDSSYAPIYRASSMWLIAIRAIALSYRFSTEEGAPSYDLQGQEVNEGAELVTTSKKLAEGMSDFAKELRELTAARKSEAPRRMADYARILREMQLADSSAQRAKNSVILMDGTLSIPPAQLIERLSAQTTKGCLDNGNILVGLSKDSNANLFGSVATDEEMLRTIDRQELLYVKVPVPKGKMPGPPRDVFYVKLHPSAPKWFRVDVASTNYDPRELFGSIAQFGRNQLCPGYPVPLAEAHVMAVMLRKYPGLYDELLFKIGQESGFTMDDIVWGRTNIEGKRRDTFHAYLDMLSRRGS